MSELSSSIGDKKRIILKNPDGTYTHCRNILNRFKRWRKRISEGIKGPQA